MRYAVAVAAGALAGYVLGTGDPHTPLTLLVAMVASLATGGGIGFLASQLRADAPDSRAAVEEARTQQEIAWMRQRIHALVGRNNVLTAGRRAGLDEGTQDEHY